MDSNRWQNRVVIIDCIWCTYFILSWPRATEDEGLCLIVSGGVKVMIRMKMVMVSCLIKSVGVKAAPAS